MSLGQLPALDHPEHVVGQLEQADPVRDGRLGAADPLGHLAERERELVDQDGVGTGLLDRRQLLAGDVLDEPEQERLAVVGRAHDGRERSRDPPPAPPASAARRRRSRSRPRRAAARAAAGSHPGAAPTPRAPTPPPARSGGAAGAGSGGSRRRGSRAARSGPDGRRSAPRGRDRGHDVGVRTQARSTSSIATFQ